MNIKPLHEGFKCPTRGTDKSGGFDIYMPESGFVSSRSDEGKIVSLGFAAEVPEGHVALIVPRSGKGVKNGLCLNNTVGVIDSDYRGEWMASLRIHNDIGLSWEAGDRLLQFMVVPVATPELTITEDLDSTDRGIGGWGSTGT